MNGGVALGNQFNLITENVKHYKSQSEKKVH